MRLQRRLTAIGVGLPATYWWLWAGMLLNRIGTFVIVFLGLYLTERRGMQVAQAGLVIAVWGLGSVAAGPVAGVLCDRFGRRATLLVSLSAGGLATMSLGFVSRPGALAAFALVIGFLGEMYRPAVQAAIADVVAPGDRARAYGLLYWAVNLGYAVAFSLGGFLASASWTALFLLDGFTSLAFAGLVLEFVPETKPAEASPETAWDSVAGIVAPLRDGVYATFLGLNFLVVLIVFQFQLALPLDIRAHGLPASAFGALLTLNGIVVILVQPAVSRFIGRFDSSRVLAVAALLLGGGFGLHALCRTMPAYAAAVVVWTLGEIANHPVASALPAQLSPPALRGRYQGAYSLSWSSAAMVAPAVGAAVLSRYGARAVWGACFAVGLVAAAGQLAAAGARRRSLAAAPPATAGALGSDSA